MKKLRQETLDALLRRHRRFLDNIELINVDGCCPDVPAGKDALVLHNYILCGLDFRGADLTGADLSGCDARGANLMGCKLPEESKQPIMTLTDVCGVEFHGGWAEAEAAFKRITLDE